MHLSRKLGKSVDPRVWQSIKVHFGRVWLTRRLVFHFDAARMIATIDREKFRALREQHAVENPGVDWPKYLDLKKWMEVNVQRVRRLQLDYGRRRDILDLGAGAGYFLYLCQWLGHRPLGLDIDEVPMYPEMARLLGLQRVVARVEAFVPLPDLGRKFDVITAFMICFNNHQRPDVWGPREWDFFLTDLRRQLKPEGRVWLELNRYRGGSDMTEELRALFVSRGAQVEDRRVVFDAPPR